MNFVRFDQFGFSGGSVLKSSRRLVSVNRTSTEFAQQRFKIEPLSNHIQFTGLCARPLFFRTIPIKLNAIAIRIAEVKSFADAVVRGAFKLYFSPYQTLQRVCKVGPRGIQNRKVIEAC